MASLRIRTGGRGETRGRAAGRPGDHRLYRARGRLLDFQRQGRLGKGSDLLLGVNLIGVVPLGRSTASSASGAGVHSIDAALLDDRSREDRE